MLAMPWHKLEIPFARRSSPDKLTKSMNYLIYLNYLIKCIFIQCIKFKMRMTYMQLECIPFTCKFKLNRLGVADLNAPLRGSVLYSFCNFFVWTVNAGG